MARVLLITVKPVWIEAVSRCHPVRQLPLSLEEEWTQPPFVALAPGCMHRSLECQGVMRGEWVRCLLAKCLGWLVHSRMPPSRVTPPQHHALLDGIRVKVRRPAHRIRVR